MRYGYYGWENSERIHSVSDAYGGIETPSGLYDALMGIWCEYSCTPRLRHRWSSENPTLGQCAITAFLAQDIFGGRVHGIIRPEGSIHCYNVINGYIIDLTSEQFMGEALSYEHNPEQSREEHFKRQEKRERYEYLKKELERRYPPK